MYYNNFVEQARYTLIGSVLTQFTTALFIVAGIFGLLSMLWPKHRWGGALLAVGSLLIVTLRVPNPYALSVLFLLGYGGGIADLLRQRERDAKALRREIALRLAATACIPALFFYIETGKVIRLGGDQLSSTIRGFGTYRSDRADVRALEMVGWRGELCEWRFVMRQKGQKDEFLANMLDSELFRDQRGQVLTGQQVATRIARWAGVKIWRESYGEYVYRSEN